MSDKKESFFAFGDPVTIEHGRLAEYLGVYPHHNGIYYVPPVALHALGQLRHMNAQHGSCIAFRRNMAVRSYLSGGLSVADFRCSMTDFLVYGNAYLEVIRNAFGHIVELKHVPALNMRVKVDGGYRQLIKNIGEYIDFTADEIIHVKEYDTQQSVYGVPDWLGGMQSAMLGSDATIFRRKYYKNGCHLGYIFYTNDPKMTPEQEKQVKDKLRSSKDDGNFKTMFVSIPNGSEKAIQIIPIGDISQKDEFQSIKNLSGSDVREAHRVPPVLMGILPQGVSTLGDPEKTERVYTSTEVLGITLVYTALNDMLPANLQFNFKYDFSTEG